VFARRGTGTKGTLLNGEGQSKEDRGVGASRAWGVQYEPRFRRRTDRACHLAMERSLRRMEPVGTGIRNLGQAL
jgi:hypothetical protein